MKKLKQHIKAIFIIRKYNFLKFNQVFKNLIKYRKNYNLSLTGMVDYIYAISISNGQRGVSAVLRLGA